MPFQQDTEVTPVVFRKERDGEITAVFPCDPADTNGNLMSCFAHVGQHSACGFEWYYTTKPALPEEYADLKQELESAPYGYRLRVYRRITSELRDRFLAEARRLKGLLVDD